MLSRNFASRVRGARGMSSVSSPGCPTRRRRHSPPAPRSGCGPDPTRELVPPIGYVRSQAGWCSALPVSPCVGAGATRRAARGAKCNPERVVAPVGTRRCALRGCRAGTQQARQRAELGQFLLAAGRGGAGGGCTVSVGRPLRAAHLPAVTSTPRCTSRGPGGACPGRMCLYAVPTLCEASSVQLRRVLAPPPLITTLHPHPPNQPSAGRRRVGAHAFAQLPQAQAHGRGGAPLPRDGASPLGPRQAQRCGASPSLALPPTTPPRSHTPAHPGAPPPVPHPTPPHRVARRSR